MVRALRLASLDSVAWYFSDAARVRAGMDAPELGSTFGVSVDGGDEASDLRLGTYAENREAMEELFDWTEAAASKEPWECMVKVNEDDPTSGFAIVDSFSRMRGMPGRGRAPNVLKRRVIETRIALQRYRSLHGSFPGELALLVPQFVPSVPRDPYADGTLRYRLEADGTYTLWSAGVNGVDDGGKWHDDNPASGLNCGGCDVNVSRSRAY